MNDSRIKSGYILPITLILIGLFVATVTYLASKNSVFSSFSKTMIDREKSRLLSLSGIQLSMSQLANASEKEKKETPAPTGKAVPPESDAKQFFKVMMPLFNVMQEFKLKRATDGIDGTIRFHIASEDGKININRMFDFKQHKFIAEGQPQGDMKKVAQQFFALLKEQTGQDLFNEFEKFLKKREYPINDVTELLVVPGFDWFKDKIFFEPSGSKDQKKPVIYLADLFTVQTAKAAIDPWLISPSLQVVFGLKRSEKLNIEELLKIFKETLTFPQDGAVLFKTLYNADYAKIAPFAPLLRTQFEPKAFSVMSTGIYGSVPVTHLAVLEREKMTAKDATGYDVFIRKTYVL